jgi:hypothetical protein
MEDELARFQTQVHRVEMSRWANGASTESPRSIKRLYSEITSVRTKYSDELSRIKRYERDPQVIAARTRLRRMQDEIRVLMDDLRQKLGLYL